MYRGNDPKEFLELINTIKKDHGGKYIDTIDFNPFFVIQLGVLGINFWNKKLVILKTKKRVIQQCKNCWYSIKKSHLLKKPSCLKCQNCHENIYLNRNGKYKKI